MASFDPSAAFLCSCRLAVPGLCFMPCLLSMVKKPFQWLQKNPKLKEPNQDRRPEGPLGADHAGSGPWPPGTADGNEGEVWGPISRRGPPPSWSPSQEGTASVQKKGHNDRWQTTWDHPRQMYTCSHSHGTHSCCVSMRSAGPDLRAPPTSPGCPVFPDAGCTQAWRARSPLFKPLSFCPGLRLLVGCESEELLGPQGDGEALGPCLK